MAEGRQAAQVVAAAEGDSWAASGSGGDERIEAAHMAPRGGDSKQSRRPRWRLGDCWAAEVAEGAVVA